MLPRPHAQGLPPVTHRLGAELRHDLLADRVEDVLLVPDVVVQGHGLHAELRGFSFASNGDSGDDSALDSVFASTVVCRVPSPSGGSAHRTYVLYSLLYSPHRPCLSRYQKQISCSFVSVGPGPTIFIRGVER